MRYQDGSHALRGGAPEKPSRWRLFPWAIAAAMGVVIAVNVGMVYAAMHTFPGQAGGNGFDLSNRYDQVIARVQRQAALGWSVRVETDAQRHPVLLLRGPDGAPLTGAAVQATAERPLGPQHSTALAFRETARGRYVADGVLAEPGQWDLLLSASAQGHDFTTTRRIVTR
jgi:nitrogen fixation protein FixH